MTTIIVPHHFPKTKPEKINKGRTKPKSSIQIIEKELEKNDVLKSYYDGWGNRIYAFYNEPNNLLINFNEAQKLGAEYVISEFMINNDNLKLICKKCNNSNTLFLYKLI